MATLATFTVPAPSREQTSNLFGLVGLVGLVVAVGGLTQSIWWALAVASVLLVALSYAGHRAAEAAKAATAKAGAAVAASLPPVNRAAASTPQGG